MKVVLIVMLVCVVGVESNIHNFLSMVGDNIQIQFRTAWDAIKQFIKRPIRYKKVYTENDESATYSYLNLPRVVKYYATTDISTTKEYSIPPDMMYYFQRTKHKMVLLPIIDIPKWKSREDWMDLQKNIGFFGGGDNSLRIKGDETTVRQRDDENSNEDDDDEDLGVMMFV